MRRRPIGRAAALVAALGGLVGLASLPACSHVTSLYQCPPEAAGTAPPRLPEVKRLQVVAWAPANRAGLSSALHAVTSDYLKLRKNVLVLAGDELGPGEHKPSNWAAACTGRTEGVLLVRALDSLVDSQVPPAAQLGLSVELLRCTDGALLYRSEGRLKRSSFDQSLIHMREHYTETLGAEVGPYIACAFSLLQELLSPLPDPQLSDSELEEKIELGG